MAILASVRFRQPPRDSVDYHLLIYCCDLDNMVCGRDARNPKFLGQYLPKIVVPSAVYANFSFRQLPRAFADYHLRIYCWGLDNMVCGRGAREPKFLIQYLRKIEVPGDA